LHLLGIHIPLSLGPKSHHPTAYGYLFQCRKTYRLDISDVNGGNLQNVAKKKKLVVNERK
jgi:hypothetical protein